MIKCCKTSYKATHTYTLFRISDILDYLYNCPFLLIKVTEVTDTYFLGWFDSLYGLWLSFIYFFCRPLLSSYHVSDTVLGTGDTKVNAKGSFPLRGSLLGENSYVNKCNQKQKVRERGVRGRERGRRERWEGREGRGGRGREGKRTLTPVSGRIGQAL